MSASNEFEFFKLRRELTRLNKIKSDRQRTAKKHGYSIPFAEWEKIPTRAEFRKMSETKQKEQLEYWKETYENREEELTQPIYKYSTLSELKEMNYPNTQMEYFLRNVEINPAGYSENYKFTKLLNSLDNDPRIQMWDKDKIKRFKDFLRSRKTRGSDDYESDFFEITTNEMKRDLQNYIDEFEDIEATRNNYLL